MGKFFVMGEFLVMGDWGFLKSYLLVITPEEDNLIYL